MDEHFTQKDTVDIYRHRFEGIIGQPVWFFTRDTMVSPQGDTDKLPIADFHRLQSDGAETGLLVHGVVERLSEELTPQYLHDPTQPVCVVHLRHTDVTTAEGGHHLTFAKNGPRSVTRVDRVYGWYEGTGDQAPEARGLAA